MSPRVVCVAFLCVAAAALAKPQNFDFNSLVDGSNPFVVQAQPVPDGGSNAPGPVRPVSGPAALLAGGKKYGTYHTLSLTVPSAAASLPLLTHKEQTKTFRYLWRAGSNAAAAPTCCTLKRLQYPPAPGTPAYHKALPLVPASSWTPVVSVLVGVGDDGVWCVLCW